MNRKTTIFCAVLHSKALIHVQMDHALKIQLLFSKEAVHQEE